LIDKDDQYQTNKKGKNFDDLHLFIVTYLSAERATGIEPAWPAWKAGTLPLSYARVFQQVKGDLSLLNSQK